MFATGTLQACKYYRFRGRRGRSIASLSSGESDLEIAFPLQASQADVIESMGPSDRLKPSEPINRGLDQCTPSASSADSVQQTLSHSWGEGETGILAAKHGESISIRTFPPSPSRLLRELALPPMLRKGGRVSSPKSQPSLGPTPLYQVLDVSRLWS